MHFNIRCASQPIPCRGNLLLLLSVLWWLIALQGLRNPIFQEAWGEGRKCGRKIIRLASQIWESEAGPHLPANFHWTSSARKGPKWRAKVCGCPHRGTSRCMCVWPGQSSARGLQCLGSEHHTRSIGGDAMSVAAPGECGRKATSF